MDEDIAADIVNLQARCEAAEARHWAICELLKNLVEDVQLSTDKRIYLDALEELTR